VVLPADVTGASPLGPPPRAVAFDAQGAIVLAEDRGGPRFLAFNETTAALTILRVPVPPGEAVRLPAFVDAGAPDLSAPGAVAASGGIRAVGGGRMSGLAAGLDDPGSVAAGASGLVYVGERGRSRIVALEAGGPRVVAAPATSPRLALDERGLLFFAEEGPG